MLALLETGVRPGDLDSAFGVICLNDDVEFPPGEGICPDHKSAWKALEKFWKELEKHLPPSIDRETSCPIQKAALQFQGQLRVSRYRLDRPAVIASLMETWDCKSTIIQNRWADTTAGKKRFKALITPLHEAFHRDVVEPYLSQWRQYVYRLSVSMLARAREHAVHERRRLNTLNYGDLLNVTARVLRENAHVRRALQQKYSFLFVDEFQDTDPVQAEIVFLLAADERNVKSGLGRTDWRKLPLRPGALFVVGDPKQSIYRFRRADIEIYNVVHDRFNDPATGRVLPLTLNFRSRPELCRGPTRCSKRAFLLSPLRIRRATRRSIRIQKARTKGMRGERAPEECSPLRTPATTHPKSWRKTRTASLAIFGRKWTQAGGNSAISSSSREERQHGSFPMPLRSRP